MSRITIMAFVLPMGALIAGCGGGDGDDGNDESAAIISAEKTVSYGQEAVTSLNGMASASEAFGEVMGQLGMIASADADVAAVQKSAMAATEETIECAGGGTVTIETSEGSTTGQTVRYTADRCVDDMGTTLHGELLVTIGQWNEFSGGDFPAIEMTLATGPAGFASDVCEFNGGLVLRLYMAESSDPYGENTFIFEYGTTDAGFISFCGPDQAVNIAANSLVRNELVFSYSEDGSMTSSNTVDVRGGFEAPDGSGYVSIVAEDLEYAVSANGDSTYGIASCPASGHITLTGDGNSTASIYFGDDAPSPYAVQVIGPDGFVAEFETCEAFLAAAG